MQVMQSDHFEIGARQELLCPGVGQFRTLKSEFLVNPEMSAISVDHEHPRLYQDSFGRDTCNRQRE